MTAQLDRAMTELRSEFADEVTAGIITHFGTQGSCRRKNHRPGAPYSEHAWPGGNAVDVTFRADARNDSEVMRVGTEISAWMRSRPDLWSEVFWLIDLHFNHVHGTANPRENYDNQQIPPCAGGDDDDMAILSDEAQRFFEDAFRTAQRELNPPTSPAYLREVVKHLRNHPSAGGGLTEADVKAIVNDSQIVAPD